MEQCKNCEYVTDNETCGAFECNGIGCPTLPCEAYWYFTFGCGQQYTGKYVKIRGTFRQTRQKMFDKYGEDWGFQYSEQQWKDIENNPERYWDIETELESIE